ncbi:MAG TPA: serine/threonine-protein kinase [Myxococcales bacterium]|jgi:serine/threonine-protein kinase
MAPLSPVSEKIPSPIPFGRYELVQRIGAGGMGEVWLARLPGLGGVSKVCVVKKMLPHLASDPTFAKRFLDEAKVVVHLNHGNIAQVLEMGEVEGEYFIAMEYVEGKTVARISSRLRERDERFPLPLALLIGSRACDALSYAHRKTDLQNRPLHVVHRDVSPSNILISYDGEVKVIDFGAAQSTMKEAHTAPRVVIGNLAYMSPEQARKRPVDGRADVYSISVVLWELIAWHALPTGGDHVERWRRAAYPRFVPPSKLQSDVPPFLDPIIMRGLAMDPLDRFPNAEELRDELQRALQQIGAKTSQSTLGALMQALFRQEANQERATVARAMAAFDAESTDKSVRRVVPKPSTQLEPEDVTMPGNGGGPSFSMDAIRAAVRAAPSAPPPRPPPPVADLEPERDFRRAPPPSPPTSDPSAQPGVAETFGAPSPSASDFDPDRTRAAPESEEVEKPPPPVDDQPRAGERRSSDRHSEELPTVTWVQQPAPRRRRFTDALTADYGPQERKKHILFRIVLFAGAFIVGVVLAVLLSQLFAGPSQPEVTPVGAPAATPLAPSPPGPLKRK